MTIVDKQITDKFRIKIQNLLNTKTITKENVSITLWKKKKEKEKFTHNILKYTLIKNFKQ